MNIAQKLLRVLREGLGYTVRRKVTIQSIEAEVRKRGAAVRWDRAVLFGARGGKVPGKVVISRDELVDVSWTEKHGEIRYEIWTSNDVPYSQYLGYIDDWGN